MDIQLLDKYVTDDMKFDANRLQDCNSVGVHVRGGDYNQFNNWLLSVDYYERAIAAVKERVKDPVFHIFSDDTTYAWSLLKDIPGKKNIIHETELTDFYLMQHCKHNIIANSTYSFWAAMLNKHPDKLVVYPKDWKCNDNPVDFKDERWIGV